MHKNKQKRPNSQIIKSALCFGAALIFFLLYILLCSTGSDVVLTGLVIVVCYILTVTLFEVLYHILFVKYKNNRLYFQDFTQALYTFHLLKNQKYQHKDHLQDDHLKWF